MIRHRRLHRHDAQQLQQMVLHHVAQCAGLVVEGAASLDAQLLGHVDLHVTMTAAAPQRLEQRVAEAQRQQVLHRLLAEIMIDPIDLPFGKDRADVLVDVSAEARSVAQRLLEHHARCRASPARPPPGSGRS
jgi:hypothetical protein